MLGDILGLTSLLIMLVTALIAIVLAIRHSSIWKNWLMGTGIGFFLFVIALIVTPGPNTGVQLEKSEEPPAVQQQQQQPVIPQVTQDMQQQQTTRSATYKQ